MTQNDYSGYFPTWCPGCGNYGIWGSLKATLANLGWNYDSFAIVFGIGCSGNMNDFIKTYGLHSLHGRAIPNAIGIRLANHRLPVIVVAGDGDLIGEGGNHLLHAFRGNYDITVLLHNNQIYGLTTGQASPTSSKGTKSKSTPEGIIETPINPVALAVTQGATFVGQGFAGNIPHLTDLMKQAIEHKGFSIVNVFQPCVTFNKVNTYQWFRERVYLLDATYDPTNRKDAIEKSFEIEQGKIPIGVLYKSKRPTYEESVIQLSEHTLISSMPHVDAGRLIDELV